MTIVRDDQVVRLTGLCRVEDAEPLAALLQGLDDSILDLSACEGLHAAVVQVIMAFGPKIMGVPEDVFLKERLLPAVIGARQSV